jgi:hypothetical protein
MKKLMKLMILALVVVGLLVAVLKDWPKKLQIDASPASGSQINADLQVSGTKYDFQSHSVKGVFGLYLKAIDNRNIHDVAFSATDTGTRDWQTAERNGAPATARQAGECQLQSSEEDEKGKPVSSATFDCKEAVMASGSGAEEIWYPFDSYRATIAPMACINSKNGACGKASKAQPVFISSLNVVIGDQNLIGELSKDSTKDDNYLLRLRRRFFVRMVSVIFLILSIVFLIYLDVAGDPKDLLPKSLGFFGALWGLRALIVPASVTIFPTIIDYSILIIFCVLFVLVVLKLYEGRNA